MKTSIVSLVPSGMGNPNDSNDQYGDETNPFADSIFDEIYDHDPSIHKNETNLPEFNITKSHDSRFMMLLIFSICQIMNTANWVCLIPIADKI